MLVVVVVVVVVSRDLEQICWRVRGQGQVRKWRMQGLVKYGQEELVGLFDGHMFLWSLVKLLVVATYK